jgi:hypothetical protein
MKDQKMIALFCSLCVTLMSCSMVQKTGEKEIEDGFYIQNIKGSKEVVYIDNDDDTLHICPTKIVNEHTIVDTLQVYQVLPDETDANFEHSTSFIKPSFDLGFLTIPLKFRVSQGNVAPQLNANLNGAIYLGYRQDRYVVDYETNPLGKSERDINHFGISFGVFTGLGNTFMSPTNTDDVLQQEYDGIIWNKGIAAILGVNRFSIGLSLGIDSLLDKNHIIWIYQRKPWLGLALGLNLN